jgi:hypothetical protein
MKESFTIAPEFFRHGILVHFLCAPFARFTARLVTGGLAPELGQPTATRSMVRN